MTEIYLRDLNEQSKKDYLNWFKKSNREDLLRAYDNGEDIIIGASFDNINHVEVV